MMTRLLFLLLPFLIFSPVSIARDHPSFYLTSFTFYDSEAVPFQQFKKDWGEKYREGNSAVSYIRHEVGASFGRWGIGYVYNDVSLITFDARTANLANILAKKQPIYGESYPIDLKIRNYQTTGIRLFFDAIRRSKFSLQLGFSALQGKSLVDGTLKGNVTVLSEKNYQFDNVVLDYYYSKDELFSHQAAEPTGDGYAFDAKIFLHLSDRQKIWANIQNISGRINWRKAPYTIATIQSDNKTYDENGYVKVSPLLQGKQLTRNFTQYLPLIASATAETDLRSNYFLLIELENYNIKTYSRIGLRKKFINGLSSDIVYDTLNQSVGFRLSHPLFQLSVLSDDTDINDAYLLAVSFDLQWAF